METKSIFASKVFWGSVITLLSQFLPNLFTVLGATPSAVVDYIVAAIGFLLAVYGRFQAHQSRVTLTGK